jgi:hypothetical protein
MLGKILINQSFMPKTLSTASLWGVSEERIFLVLSSGL